MLVCLKPVSLRHLFKSPKTYVLKSGQVKQIIFSVKLPLSYPSIEMYVLGALKNPLKETVLFSAHNISFRREIRKIVFNYAIYLEACENLSQDMRFPTM